MSGKKTLRYALLLVLLAVAAVAAAYFLYFGPGLEQTPPRGVELKTPPGAPLKVTTKVQAKLTPQETWSVHVASFQKEFKGILDNPASARPLMLPDVMAADLPPNLGADVPYEAALKEPLFADQSAGTTLGTSTEPGSGVKAGQSPEKGTSEKTAPAKTAKTGADKKNPAQKTASAETAGGQPTKPATLSTSPDKTDQATSSGTEKANPGQPSGPPPVPTTAQVTPNVTTPAGPQATPPLKTEIIAPRTSKSGGWVVQILATPDKDQARRLMDALVKTPYQIYAYQSDRNGQPWYRVRVGFFGSKAEALAAGQALAQEHRLAAPWVVKPGPEEMAKYNKQ